MFDLQNLRGFGGGSYCSIKPRRFSVDSGCLMHDARCIIDDIRFYLLPSFFLGSFLAFFPIAVGIVPWIFLVPARMTRSDGPCTLILVPCIFGGLVS